MLRAFAITALLITAIGCASHPKPATVAADEASLASSSVCPESAPVAHLHTPSPAVALAFDPHVPTPEIAVDLSRSQRQPSAFLGYDEGVVEFFSIRTDDRQYGSLGLRGGSGGYGSGFSDYFEREAVSVKTGVRYH